MQDPHVVLGLNQDASEAEIRQRYLELLRQFPPEREPQRAAEVRAAYDLLRDPLRRLSGQLFGIKSYADFDSILVSNQPKIPARRFTTGFLLSLGQP